MKHTFKYHINLDELATGTVYRNTQKVHNMPNINYPVNLVNILARMGRLGGKSAGEFGEDHKLTCVTLHFLEKVGLQIPSTILATRGRGESNLQFPN